MMVKQRRKMDCVVAALASVKGISYAAALKIIPDAVNGYGDTETRLMAFREVGPVHFTLKAVDGVGVYQTWADWKAEHPTGRYMVSVYGATYDKEHGLGYYGPKHCVAVVDGTCNDPHVYPRQLVDWWAEFIQ